MTPRHQHAPGAPSPRRRLDPLGLWLCGLAILGLARTWMYLVRDGGAADAVGWIWLAGSLLMAGIGIVLLARGLPGAARRRPDPPPPR
ncbi:hypothetical protein [Luteimonas changyuni]|uniref:hypothetical protein n=1 Tax=Luteimonas sp. MJ145 TaxID=3129234 RepID=UPI0031BAAAD9